MPTRTKPTSTLAINRWAFAGLPSGNNLRNKCPCTRELQQVGKMKSDNLSRCFSFLPLLNGGGLIRYHLTEKRMIATCNPSIHHQHATWNTLFSVSYLIGLMSLLSPPSSKLSIFHSNWKAFEVWQFIYRPWSATLKQLHLTPTKFSLDMIS